MSGAENNEAHVRILYHRLLDAWNGQNAENFAAPFAEDGTVVGFDGSQHIGRAEIAAEMRRIFSDHATGAYVGKIRRFRPLGPSAGMLHAVAGIVPAGRTDLEPSLTPFRRSSRSNTNGNDASSCTRTRRRSSMGDPTSVRI
jgi:uncharacterized protein (TIGR02246 family)